MSIIVYEDRQGDLYGFCSRKCLDDWRHSVACPYCPMSKEDLPEGVSVGCWCCGKDLMNQEGIIWMTPKDLSS